MRYPYPKIAVPEAKYKEINKAYCAHTIAESGKVKTFMYQNVEYVCTGGAVCSAKGLDESNADPVIELSAYKGELTPLKYSEHWREVDKGNREREYAGMLVVCGKDKRQLVFLPGRVTFHVAKPMVADEPEARVDHRGQYKLFFA